MGERQTTRPLRRSVARDRRLVDAQGRRHRVQVAERVARDPPLAAVRPSRGSARGSRRGRCAHGGCAARGTPPACRPRSARAGGRRGASGRRGAPGSAPSRTGFAHRVTVRSSESRSLPSGPVAAIGRGARALGRGRGSQHDPGAQRDGDARVTGYPVKRGSSAAQILTRRTSLIGRVPDPRRKRTRGGHPMRSRAPRRPGA